LQRAIAGKPCHFELRLAGKLDGDEFCQPLEAAIEGDRADHAVAQRLPGVQRGVEVLPRALRIDRSAR
jgi:hypothetical protein